MARTDLARDIGDVELGSPPDTSAVGPLHRGRADDRAKVVAKELRGEPCRWGVLGTLWSIGSDDDVKVDEPSALDLCDLEVVDPGDLIGSRGGQPSSRGDGLAKPDDRGIPEL